MATPSSYSRYMRRVEANPDRYGPLPVMLEIPGGAQMPDEILHWAHALGDRSYWIHKLRARKDIPAYREAVGLPPLSDRELKSSGLAQYETDEIDPRAPKGAFVSRRNLEVPLGDAAKYAIHRALYGIKFSMPYHHKGSRYEPIFVPGSMFGLNDDSDFDHLVGPYRPYDVAMVGKWPGWEEESRQRTLCGKAGRMLDLCLTEAGIDDRRLEGWYATNAVRFCKPAGASDADYPAFARFCELMLEIELRLIAPKLIICLGADAAKSLLKTRASVAEMRGQVFNYPLRNVGPGGEVVTQDVPLVVVPNPVLYDGSKRPNLVRGLVQARQIFDGEFNPTRITDKLNIVFLRDAASVREVVRERIRFRREQPPTADTGFFQDLMCVDCEWHGTPPAEPGSYGLSIQFCWDERTAYVVLLHDQGGIPLARPSVQDVLDELRPLFDDGPNWRVRVGGHFFKEDLQFLQRHGLDLSRPFAPAPSPERMRHEGGWDTICMFQGIQSDGDRGLKPLAVLYLDDVPPWDGAVDAGLRRAAKELGVGVKSLRGFGVLRFQEVHGDREGKFPPYSALDVVYNLMLAKKCLYGMDGEKALLDACYLGPDSWAGYWHALRKQIPASEMELSGFELDEERFAIARESFMQSYANRLGGLQEMIRWPNFNPNSSQHMIELMYGEKYIRKYDESGRPVRQAPEGAACLHLTPLFEAGQKGKPWATIVRQGLDGKRAPHTGSKSVDTIYFDTNIPDPVRAVLKEVKLVKKLGQAIKDKLQPPLTISDGVAEKFVRRPDGRVDYKGGFGKAVRWDGRVSTRLGMVETWRGCSGGPNLQNLSAKNDAIYKEAMTFSKNDQEERLYTASIRSTLRSPDGYLMVSSDYSGAEVFGIGIMANDMKLIQRVLNKEDLHCIMAHKIWPETRAYPADKKIWGADKDLDLKRSLAKIPSFACPYGAAPPTIQAFAWQSGQFITIEDATRIRDGWMEEYAECARELEISARRVHTHGWIGGFRGCIRRVLPGMLDEFELREFERQFMNFRIQNMVAVCVIEALNNLIYYRDHILKDPTAFRLCLEVHDAVMAHVREDMVEEYVDRIVPLCMTDWVPVTQYDHDGRPVPGATQYHMEVESSVYKNWGVKFSRDEAIARRLPDREPFYDPKAKAA